MKNVLVAFVACFVSIVAVAQSKIEKDLQGTWKMTEMNVGGTFANATTKEIKFSKEIESQLTPEKRAAFNTNKQAFLDKIGESRMSFSDRKINYVIGDIIKDGTYTIKPQADAYVLTVTGSDGSNDVMIIGIKNGKLHIVESDDKNRGEMVFSKIVIK